MANLKYAHVERERRWLLAAVPDLPHDARRLTIVDRYVRGTRLRLREVTEGSHRHSQARPQGPAR